VAVAVVALLGQLPPVLGAAGATGAVGATGGVAVAADRSGPVRPAAQATSADEPLPVAVTVRRLEPREIRPDSTITVVATLTNTGSSGTGPLRVRLQRGALISTRSELAAADAAPPPTTNTFAASQLLDRGIAAGRSITTTYRCTAAELRLVNLGVYPVSFEVRGTTNGVPDTVGRVRTVLPFFPSTIAAKPTRVAWVWPLLDRPHRLIGGGGRPLFTDEGLAAAVLPGGRLDRLLTAVEQVPAGVRLTLVVDPEVIQALTLMTGDYRVRVGTRTVPGTGSQAATAWLARLRGIARRHVIAAVPYADPDVVALQRGGVDDHLYRLQESDLDALDRDLNLPVAPSRLAWPPGGLLTDDTLDELVEQTDAVILDSAALPQGISQQTPTPSAVSPLPALRGQTVALVTDAELQRVVARSTGFAGGSRLAEQRYLAELAMITAQNPSDQRTYVITPPRRWSPSSAYANAVLRDTGAVSWLTSLSVPDAAASTQAVDRGPLSYPAGAQRAELSAVQVRRIGEAQRRLTDFRSALTNSDANTLLSGYDDALRRSASSAWRDSRALGESYTRQLFNTISWLRSRVTAVRPTTGIYTLTSADSPLSLTIRNDLATPVTIRVHIDTSTAPGFRVQDIGPQQIPAGARITLRLPASVQRAGTFSVRVRLATPQGGALGSRITLTVRSTAYGAVALGITGAALLVLVVAITVRLARRLRNGGGEVLPPGTPADRKVL
jgi:hypothetical protein